MTKATSYEIKEQLMKSEAYLEDTNVDDNAGNLKCSVDRVSSTGRLQCSATYKSNKSLQADFEPYKFKGRKKILIEHYRGCRHSLKNENSQDLKK